jgi:GTP cyclohydrolase IA
MKKTPAAHIVETLPRRRPSRQEAEDAVRTLLAWAGDDPARPGLADTPQRVADAYGEYFGGYKADARAELSATFEDTAGYKDMVMLSGIRFESHCEHHIAPFHGLAHVAYIPDGRIVGLSKIARVVDIFARRLQTQENLTCEIAAAIADGLSPKGVAVMMSAEHHCMSARGVRLPHVATVTTHFLGRFETGEALKARFVALARSAPPMSEN